jgi:hypothetical protein
MTFLYISEGKLLWFEKFLKVFEFHKRKTPLGSRVLDTMNELWGRPQLEESMAAFFSWG